MLLLTKIYLLGVQLISEIIFLVEISKGLPIDLYIYLLVDHINFQFERFCLAKFKRKNFVRIYIN